MEELLLARRGYLLYLRTVIPFVSPFPTSIADSFVGIYVWGGISKSILNANYSVRRKHVFGLFAVFARFGVASCPGKEQMP